MLITSLFLLNVTMAFAADSGKVAVVYSSGTEAFNEAIEGLRGPLVGASYSVVLIDLKSQLGDLQNVLNQPGTKAVVAVGSDATVAIAQTRINSPVMAMMIMTADRNLTGQAQSQTISSVYLDVPAAGMLSEIKNVYPGKTRIGIIRNPGVSGFDSGFAAKAKGLGLNLQIVDCPSANKLLSVFLSLRGKVDLVICLPDGALFNSTTIQPFILASLENNLPIAGFSAAFTRAGAAIGIYPDYRDIGAKTAENVLRHLAGEKIPAAEYPRKLSVAINPRVIRLLGLHINPPADSKVARVN